MKKEHTITFQEYDSISELPQIDKLLIEAAHNAAKNAYAPYSKFKVGAAVMLTNGKTVTGSNQENAAYPSGLCAERVALFSANSLYPDVAVKTLAICAISNGDITSMPVTPCGSCRQVMFETEMRYKQPYRVILYGKGKTIIIDSVHHLLPLAFDDSFLK